MIKLSLIIPCYNAVRYIEQQLMSLTNQIKGNDIEIICVNDGSKDNTLDVLNKLSESYSYIRVIDQNNGGPAVARNTGLKNANGDYIWFVDADDIINPESINSVLAAIDKYHTDIICFNYQEIDMQDNVLNNIVEYNYSYENVMDAADAYSKYNIPAYLWNRIMKRKFIDSGNIRFKIIPEDEDFLLHTYCVANTLVFIPHVVYKYRLMDVSFGKNSKTHVKYYNGYYEILEKFSQFIPQRSDRFWQSFLFTCIKNILINYNRVKVVDSNLIPDTRREMYKKINLHLFAYKNCYSAAGKKGFFIKTMQCVPFIFDLIVYLKYKLES